MWPDVGMRSAERRAYEVYLVGSEDRSCLYLRLRSCRIDETQEAYFDVQDVMNEAM